MSICISCDTVTLETVNAFKQNAVCVGKQIKAVYAQNMAGSDFDGQAIAGTEGGDVELEADWTAKESAVGVDKIILVPEISAVQFPVPTQQVLEGADSPGGVREVTELAFNVTFDLIRLNQSTYAQAAAMDCWPLMRIWLQDENDFVYGLVNDTANVGEGIPNVRFAFGGNGFPNTNQPKPQFIQISMSWINAKIQLVSETPLSFLASVFAPA